MENLILVNPFVDKDQSLFKPVLGDKVGKCWRTQLLSRNWTHNSEPDGAVICATLDV